LAFKTGKLLITVGDKTETLNDLGKNRDVVYNLYSLIMSYLSISDSSEEIKEAKEDKNNDE